MFTIHSKNTWDDTVLSPIKIDIFSLVLEHKEGCFALLKVRTQQKNDTVTPFQGKVIALVDKQNLIQFQGVLCSLKSVDEKICELHFVAKPIEVKQKLEKLILDNKLQVNPLLFKDDIEPRDYLEDTDYLFHWDKVSGQVSLDNFFQGDKTINIGNGYLENSLKILNQATALQQFTIELKVSWIQTLEGAFDLWPTITNEFPNGQIIVDSPERFTKRMPKNFDHVGNKRANNGYQVLKSEVESYPIALQTPDHKQMFRLDGQLLMEWQYRQKRSEHITFGFTNGAINTGEHKKLHMHISLPESQEQKFLETEQGQTLYENLKKIGLNYLKTSTRQQLIKFMLPFEQAKHITLRDNLQLILPLYQKPIVAKVVQYCWCVKFEKSFVEITLGYQDTHYSSDNIQTEKTITEAEGYSYENFRNTLPVLRVETETLVNKGQTVPKKLHIHLQDLRTNPCITRKIHIKHNV